MLEKAIVGVDGREGGRDALALAHVLAPSAVLTLVHAYPVRPELAGVADQEFVADLHRQAEMLIEELRPDAGPRSEALVMPDASPARALQETAEARGAELLVIGSSHRGPVGRVLLGSVGRDLLHGAPCPVAVAPHGHRGERVQTIGAGLDETDEAARALRFAADLADSLGASLRVRMVVRPLMSALAPYAYGAVAASIDEDEQERLRGVLKRALAGLDASLVADGDVTVGYPPDELERLSEDVDLLVVGSRGWGPVRRVVLGSTSDRLVHRAACPVVVVPRAEG